MSRIPKPSGTKRSIDDRSICHDETLSDRSVLQPPNSFKAPAVPKVVPRTEKVLKKAAPVQPNKNVLRTTGKEVRPSAVPREKAPINEPPSKKKRPAWDLKGRLEELESKMSASANEQESLREKLAEIERQNSLLENKNVTYQATVQQTSAEVEELLRSNRNLENKLLDAKEELDRLRRNLENANGELNRTKVEKNAMENAMAEMSGQSRVFQIEIDVAKSKLKTTEQELDAWRKRCLVAEENLAEAKEKLSAGELDRRRLHNMVVELKGNIRVFCRMRPLLEREEGGAASHSFYSFPDRDSRQIEITKVTGDSNETCKAVRFDFDRVFVPESGQMEVFEEISQLVQSALDGYNVCVFAYGQTGSGKTYTMEGGEDFEQSPGMVTLAMRQIFTSSSQLEEHGWQFNMEASFLEIYNETLRDLLAENREGPNLEIKLVQSSTNQKGRCCQNEVTVPGLIWTNVTQVDEVHRLILKARGSRAVAATKCNERSSRSHSIFMLKINSRNQRTGVTCQGSLNLVDLAGSERLKESCSEGQRLEETKNINRSLSCLGQVFASLSKKESHIPYRNSKLTYLLQNSLGGNSKTLMFVNVSPKPEHSGETLNSLRFAAMVNQCHIGAATKKVP